MARLTLDGADLRRAYERGATIAQLAAQHGCSTKAIRTRLLAHGTVMRPVGRRAATHAPAPAPAGRRTERSRRPDRDEVIRRLQQLHAGRTEALSQRQLRADGHRALVDDIQALGGMRALARDAGLTLPRAGRAAGPSLRERRSTLLTGRRAVQVRQGRTRIVALVDDAVTVADLSRWLAEQLGVPGLEGARACCQDGRTWRRSARLHPLDQGPLTLISATATFELARAQLPLAQVSHAERALTGPITLVSRS